MKLFQTPPSRGKAIILALIVVVLWSTSWVLIKIGLREIPAITFGGLRYSLGFLFLLPLLFHKQNRESIKKFSLKNWILLGGLGILNITILQGAQFLGLALLPSVTVSLVFNLTPLLVTLLGIAFLREIPAARQWAGVAINLVGILIYFLPLSHENSQPWGLLVVVIGLAANAATTLLGRKVNREKLADPITVTGVSIGIGSIFLLAGGLISQGLPMISLTGWMIILFMALVNTALAFTLWNYTQQTLRAMESSMLNGFMLVFIAIFAWIFIGESLTSKSIIGMVIAIIGGILVQLPKKNRNIPASNDPSN